MKRTIPNEVLSEIAKRSVLDDGRLADGSATWSRFGDFKMRWKRSFSYIDFQVSDYLNAAPQEVIYDLFRTVLKKIYGEPEDHKGFYKESVLDYIQSDKFRKAKRSTFLARKRFQDGEGDVHDLNKLLAELIESGECEDNGTIACWTDVCNPDYVGHSALFRVVAVPKSYDREEIPPSVIRKLVAFGSKNVARANILMRDTSKEQVIREPDADLTDEEEELLVRYS